MKHVAVLDLEIYPNFSLIGMKDVATGKVAQFEYPFDLDRVRKVLTTYQIITFNGLQYDVPLLLYMLKGATPAELKYASDRIIVGGVKPWNFDGEFGVICEDPNLSHIDLMAVAPGKGSLKLYGARMHSETIQDLPYPPETVLTEEQKEVVRVYSANDLQLTVDLYNTLKTQIELREAMSQEYGIDVRSKSDAQIAEAVMKKEMERITNHVIKKPAKPSDQFMFRYTVPSWMDFSCVDILDDIRQSEFRLSDAGKVLMPPALANRKIKLEKGIYRMGIGGLHSSETKVQHHADEEYALIDRDVTNYYPAIILNLELFPKELGRPFLDVYRKLVNDRIAAKRAKQTIVAESLKICVNGLFGKLGNRYSIVYSPELLVQVTLTGQLSLLMLIESLCEEGMEVISANTDGVFIKCRRGKVDRVNEIVAQWEARTGFKTEEAAYSAYYGRDVNNYLAVKTDGISTKAKGAFGEGLPLQKNPATAVCVDALIYHLTLGASIEQSIRSCQDPRRFLVVRQVNGGAIWGGEKFGRVNRWYYSTNGSPLTYATNGNKVPKSDGAKPMMTLEAGIPADLDYDWYVAETYEMLNELGV